MSLSLFKDLPVNDLILLTSVAYFDGFDKSDRFDILCLLELDIISSSESEMSFLESVSDILSFFKNDSFQWASWFLTMASFLIMVLFLILYLYNFLNFHVVVPVSQTERFES